MNAQSNQSQANNNNQESNKGLGGMVEDGINKVADSVSDGWIESKIKSIFAANESLSALDIQTNVKDDNVVLSGNVNDNVEKDLAEELILEIDGVNTVTNQLNVANQTTNDSRINKIKQWIDDSTISTLLNAKLRFDSDSDASNVTIKVEDNVVYLSGSVPTQKEFDLFESKAKKTTGVRDVINKIACKSN